ncbi:hypothetical protein OROGR_007539 [Orobanche gracilis]
MDPNDDFFPHYSSYENMSNSQEFTGYETRTSTQFISNPTQNCPIPESVENTNSTERIASLAQYMRNRDQLRSREAHKELMNDLIEHVWENFNDED